jgi:hypothetical protein
MDNLASYLRAQLPEGMSYMDATQLCLRLYCTIEGVPERLLPLSKETLSNAFGELARTGWVRDDKLLHSYYGVYLHAVTDRGHWIEVMASVLKSRDVVNVPRGETLARHVGFVKGKGPV